MNRYFMTDIHGDYTGMKLLLEHVGADFSVDQIVFGGDMIDRGRDSAAVLKFIKALMDRHPNNVHAIIGNHEEMLADYYRYGDTTWMHNGGFETLRNFDSKYKEDSEKRVHIDWVCSLPLFFEDDTFIYVHAGLNPDHSLNEQSREILWMSEESFYSIPRKKLLNLTGNKTVVHGHTPVELIYWDGVRINCDLGSNSNAIEGECGLGLVNLTEMCVYVYMQGQKKIEVRKIVEI